jgi:integrase
MVRLQRLTGARPGEICVIRGCDIDMSDGECWLYRPHKHKTQHLGRERVIALAEDAKAIVQKWLRPNLTEYLFQTAEMERWRHQQRRLIAKRIQRLRWPSQMQRRPGVERKQFNAYITPDQYSRAVRVAAKKADAAAHRENPAAPAEKRLVSQWHPHQLRHAFATDLADRQGIADASKCLGHSDERITRRYVHPKISTLKRIAMQA